MAEPLDAALGGICACERGGDPMEAATGVCARDPRQALTFAPFTRGEQ